MMPGRQFDPEEYRHGFQGQEKDDEIKGTGNSLDFGARMYDPRIGRWSALDRFSLFYAGGSNYSFALNNPIANIDFEGNFVVKGNGPEEVKRLNQIIAAAWSAMQTNPFLLEKLKEHSGLTDDELEFIFTDGKGPVLEMATLNITESQKEYAQLSGVENLGPFLSGNEHVTKIPTISMDILFLKDEFGSSDVHLWFATMVLLHELVHVGDRKDGIQGNNIDYESLPHDFKQRLLDAQSSYDPQYLRDLYPPHGFEPGKAFEVDIANYGIELDNMVQRMGDFLRNTKRFLKNQGKGQNGSPSGSPSGSDYTRGSSCNARFCCFIAGTRILMANGETKNIENVQVGDSVITVNTNTLSVMIDAVREVASPDHDDIVEISLADSTVLKNTFDHSYFVKDKGWCSYKPELTNERYDLNANQLETGDQVYRYNSNGQLELVKVLSIVEDVGEIKTYNLFVKGENRNYFANGVLVHDESPKEVKVSPQMMERTESTFK